MHTEFYQLSEGTAKLLNNVQQKGGRIISVGTTSTRTLETIATNNGGKLVAESGWTDIFIYPGYQFQAIDGMITNFHLPKSTLVMLVSAFAGREQCSCMHMSMLFRNNTAFLALAMPCLYLKNRL